MAKYTPENCAALANQVVENMDLKDLIRCMADQIEENYLEDEELFNADCENYSFEENDDSHV